jgi:regulator of replication initiation timing
LAVCEYFPALKKEIDEKVGENQRLKMEN